MKPSSGNIASGVLLIFVLVAATIGGYFWWQNQNNKVSSTGGKTKEGFAKTYKQEGAKLYENRSSGYQFEYPANWAEAQSELGSTAFTIHHCEQGNATNCWIITNGFISKEQLSMMGITYCGAYPEDTARCQTLKRAAIDWGIPSDNRATVSIPHTNGGLVTFTLTPVIPQTKTILIQLLSTFKFLNQDSEQANWKTYTNTKFRYRLKYPAEWQPFEAKESPVDPNEYGGNLEPGELQKVTLLKKDTGVCNFKVLENPSKYSLEEWQKIYNPTAASGYELVTKPIEGYTLDSIPAKKLKVFLFDHDDTTILAVKDGYFYLISYSNTEGNANYNDVEQTTEAICKNIVSTFTFL